MKNEELQHLKYSMQKIVEEPLISMQAVKEVFLDTKYKFDFTLTKGVCKVASHRSFEIQRPFQV